MCVCVSVSKKQQEWSGDSEIFDLGDLLGVTTLMHKWEPNYLRKHPHKRQTYDCIGVLQSGAHTHTDTHTQLFTVTPSTPNKETECIHARVALRG